MDDGTVYGTPGYMDPSSFTSKVTVKAIYDYQARHDDELSFCKHAIITNVIKCDDGWWRGDYGGKKQHLFPCNYVEELEFQENQSETVSVVGIGESLFIYPFSLQNRQVTSFEIFAGN